MTRTYRFHIFTALDLVQSVFIYSALSTLPALNKVKGKGVRRSTAVWPSLPLYPRQAEFAVGKYRG
jgi:hypothetical protein